jgi:hypothetical protein
VRQRSWTAKPSEAPLIFNNPGVILRPICGQVLAQFWLSSGSVPASTLRVTLQLIQRTASGPRVRTAKPNANMHAATPFVQREPRSPIAQSDTGYFPWNTWMPLTHRAARSGYARIFAGAGWTRCLPLQSVVSAGTPFSSAHN